MILKMFNKDIQICWIGSKGMGFDRPPFYILIILNLLVPEKYTIRWYPSSYNPVEVLTYGTSGWFQGTQWSTKSSTATPNKSKLRFFKIQLRGKRRANCCICNHSDSVLRPQNCGCVTFSGKIKRFSSDQIPPLPGRNSRGL